MNLAAGSNLTPASMLTIARRLCSGLAVALACIFLCASCQSHAAVSVQGTQCFCQADAVVRYESELTGFAEIDAPGRKTSSARVFKNLRGDGNPIRDDHETNGDLPQNLLILKSPLLLSIADSRPSLQDFEIRLQI